MTRRLEPRRAAALLGVLLAAAPARAFKPGEPFELQWRADGVAMTELAGHSGPIESLAVFPDGKSLLTAGDRTLRVWDVATRAERKVFRLEGSAFGAALSLDGRRILSSESNGVRLRDAETGTELRSFPDGFIGRYVFLSDGRRVAGIGQTDIVVADLETGAPLRTVSLRVPDSRPGDDFLPDCADVSADGRLAAALTGKKGRLYDLETGAMLREWSLPKAELRRCVVAFSPDGKTILESRLEKSVVLLAAADGKELVKLEVKGGERWDSIQGAAFSRDGKSILAGTTRGLWVWKIPSGWNAVRGGDYQQFPIPSPDGRLTFSKVPGDPLSGGVEYGGAVSVVDVETGRSDGAPLRGARTDRIALSPDGRSLTGYGIDDASLAVFDKAFASCFAASERGFELMAACLKTMRTQAFAAEPLPARTELTQGAYESTAGFNARVAASQAAYEKALAEREKRIEDWKLPEAAMPAAFFKIFGAPRVTNTAYDPDARAFTFDLVADGANAGGFKARFGLKDQIPNDQAEEFEKTLRAGQVFVDFRVQDGEFALDEVRVLLPDGPVFHKYYAALPADAAAAREPARVSVGGTGSAPIDADPLDVAFGYSQNPELAVKQRELNAARKKKATAEKIAALEAELHAIAEAGSAGYESDVDLPVAARPENPDAYAVVAGVESYRISDLPQARFAERDARSVAQRLMALGVPPRNMKVLIGADATRAKLGAVMEEWLPQHVSANSTVYFYFSGHGAPDAASGDSYLVPWDGDPSLLARTGYPLRDLYADLGKASASRRVAVLDACFSGSGGRSLLAKGARPLVNLHAVDSGDVTVLAAASANQITATLESQGHGLFTYHFLKALGAGGRAASAVYADLKPKVQDDAARQSREQTPAFFGPDATIP